MDCSERFFSESVLEPIGFLACDDMNCAVDCLGRWIRCVKTKLENVPISASNQSYATFCFGTASSVGCPWLHKVCCYLPNRMASSNFAGCIQRKRFDCFHGHNSFNLRTYMPLSVSCGFQSTNVPRVHGTSFRHATKTFGSPDQCVSANLLWMRHQFIELHLHT